VCARARARFYTEYPRNEVAMALGRRGQGKQKKILYHFKIFAVVFKLKNKTFKTQLL